MFIRFLFSILFFSSLAQASTFSCANYFAKNVAYYLDVVNSENNHSLVPDSVSSTLGNFWWYKRWRINLILKRVQREGLVNERDLLATTESLMVWFFGTKDVVDRYIFKRGKDSVQQARQQENIRYQISRQLIQTGLRSFLKDNPPQAHKKLIVRFWRSTKRVLRYIYQHPILNYLQFPFGLPHRQSHPIPEDLMLKVIWDGADAHMSELQAYLKKQSRQDIYMTVRRLYAPIFIGTLTIMSYNKEIEKQEAESHAKATLIVESLNDVSDNLPQQIRNYKIEVYETNIKAAITEFEAENKRPATAEEIQTIRRIMYEN